MSLAEDEDKKLKSKTPRYIVGSGWWSTEESNTVVNPKRKNVGDPFIRSVDFFDHWLSSVRRYSAPQSIIVVDSNSPQKPSLDRREGVQWVSLPFNAKHSTDHVGVWCGWTRSVIVSATYAMAADCEYFVYVEQDCLLKGDGIIEACVSQMKTGVMFGCGNGTPQPIQQSLFVISAKRLPRFVSNLCSIKLRDCDLSPEWKFLCATWRPFVFVANLGLFKHKRVRKLAYRLAKNRLFEFLPFGVGRNRPIPFEKEMYYFQHGSLEEVHRYLKECIE